MSLMRHTLQTIKNECETSFDGRGIQYCVDRIDLNDYFEQKASIIATILKF